MKLQNIVLNQIKKAADLLGTNKNILKIIQKLKICYLLIFLLN